LSTQNHTNFPNIGTRN